MFVRAARTIGFPISTPDNLYDDPNSNVLNTKVASQNVSPDKPLCLWIAYLDVDPASDVTSWVHTAAVDHVASGRIAVLGRRW